MSGICGIFSYRKKKPVDRTLIRKMSDLLAHRGPDAEGFYFDDDNGIGFGHRNLLIIDLVTGNQPMNNEDNSISVICDGRIYNYKELRKRLIGEGHTFTTMSDTEVIIHAYEEYGIDCLRRFNGIFAFALWDKREKSLFIARDQVGVKPIYYFASSKNVVFSSEIKSILLHPEYTKDMDFEALDLFLTYRQTPSPKTLFKGINKIRPGCYLHIKDGEVCTKSYWNYVPEIISKKSGKDWIFLLHEYLEKAISRQMVGDVPISLSLSGGVDSSTILAIMQKFSEEKVKCFTIGFEDNKKYDEVENAKTVANLFSADINAKVVSSIDYEKYFDKYIWHLEEPIGNESALAYYFVATLAKESNIKVLLNGQGPDELFGGYGRYLGERYHYLVNLIPNFSKRRIYKTVKNEQIRRAVRALSEKNELERFLLIYSIFFPEERKCLYNETIRKKIYFDRTKDCLAYFIDKIPELPSLNKMFYIDTRFSVPDNILLAEDKMAMAASVEARVPYLDIEFLELAEKIPYRYKIKGNQYKYIFKKMALNWLSRGFVYKKKIGFNNPMEKWLRKEFVGKFDELIKSKGSFTNTYFNRNYVEAIFKSHIEGKNNFMRHLFLIISLEQWYKKFFA